MADEPSETPKFDASNPAKYFSKKFLKNHIDLGGKGKKAAEIAYMRRRKALEKTLLKIKTELERAFALVEGKKKKLKPVADHTAAKAMCQALEKLIKKCTSKEDVDQANKILKDVRSLAKLAESDMQWKAGPINTLLCLTPADFKKLAAEVYLRQVAKHKGSFVTARAYPYFERGSKGGKPSQLQRAHEGKGRVEIGLHHETFIAMHFNKIV